MREFRILNSGYSLDGKLILFLKSIEIRDFRDYLLFGIRDFTVLCSGLWDIAKLSAGFRNQTPSTNNNPEIYRMK